MEEGKPDEAIRILERAINLHPGNGENYYYLAEAWRMKKNAPQALEYNALAAIRFKDDLKWMERIALQKRRIGWIK
jgi:tetratricopeptide (TPR) repeat protein